MLFFLLLLPSLSAQAADLCAEGPCTAAQSAIQTAYNAHPGFAAAAPGAVFSGPCYHQWPNLDPEHEHYGLTVLDGVSSAPTFRALFSFFAPKDPYAGMSYQQADQLLRQEGGEAAPLAVTTQEATAEFKSSEGSIRYWVRTDGRDLYLLGEWLLTSGSARSWCHFTRSPGSAKAPPSS